MTDFTTIEQSAASGKPVELFDLAMGTEHWYLTSAGYDITYLYHTYESAPCGCTELKQSSEGGSDDMELEIPRGHALAVMCVAAPPDQQVSLTIYHGHDPYYTKYYTGYLNNFKFNANSIPCLIFGSASSDMPTKGGRRRAMKQCDLKLYGFRCGVNKTAHEITGTIDTIDGVTITATEFGAAAATEPEVYGDLTGLPGCTYAASTANADHPASMAFDNIMPSYWLSTGDAPQSFYCKFPAATLIKKIRIKPQPYLNSQAERFFDNEAIAAVYAALAGVSVETMWNARTTGSYFNIRYFRVQGSNNGSDWTDIDAVAWDGDCQLYTGEGGDDTEILYFDDPSKWISVTLNNTTEYTYYQIVIYDTWYGSGPYTRVDPKVWVAEVEMIEADNTMTTHQFGAGGSIVVGNAERTIIYHNGDTVIISRPFRSNVAAGDSFRAYRGCDHSTDVCREVFNNIINYGGRQHMPTKNPYTGRNSLVT